MSRGEQSRSGAKVPKVNLLYLLKLYSFNLKIKNLDSIQSKNIIEKKYKAFALGNKKLDNNLIIIGS